MLPRHVTLTEGAREPYRALLRPVRDAGGHSESCWPTCGKRRRRCRSHRHRRYSRPAGACQPSLAAGLTTIADGKLLDLIRKLDTFGAHLVTLDVRQESTRHSDLMGEITLALELGDYRDWNEAEKQAFLEKEINDLRPLIPIHFQCTAPCQEVLDTFAVIAKAPREALGCYVISMASDPRHSRGAAVAQGDRRPAGPACVPLFETLDDQTARPKP